MKLTSPSSSRIGPARLVLIGITLAGLTVVAVAIADAGRVRLWTHHLRSADPAARKRALVAIADAREDRAADDVLAVIRHERDRELLELAANAAMRIDDARAVPLLRERCDAGPDDSLRARLIRCTARLSGGDARLIEWLEAGVASPEPWRRAGSAMGLLELQHTEGGQRLIEMASALPVDVAQFALDQFRSIAGPMATAVGRPLAACGDRHQPADAAACWAELGEFWPRYATVRLLSDCLARTERFDLAWNRVNRLRHGREYAVRLLN